MRERQQQGFTLIEVMVAVLVIAILAIATVPRITDWADNLKASTAASDMASAVHLARAEAIRTRTNHLVFFQNNAAGIGLTDSEGQAVAMAVARDDNGDGAPAAAEIVFTVPIVPGTAVAWGHTLATTRVPGDPQGSDILPPVSPWTFTTPGGLPAQWFLYTPDGTPRGFRILPFDSGAVGDGSGAVYVTSGLRDYALVVAPLGGVRVHSWNGDANAWRQ